MLPRLFKSGVRVLLLACALVGAKAPAQSLLNEVHTIASASQAVPVEESFSISVAGTYQIQLVDLGAALPTPAPLTSVELAISNGDTLVSSTNTGTGSTPPAALLTAAGTATFTATPGTYVIHVIGTPGSGAGSGLIGMTITNTKDSSQVAAFSDTLAVPPQALPSNEVTLSGSFTLPSTVTAPGSYQVSLTDLKLPASLGTLTLLLIAQGGTTPLAVLPDTTNNNAMQATVTLSPGTTYQIFAVAQAATSAAGGLFSAFVTSTTYGYVAYGKTLPVGSTTLLGSSTLSAGTYTLNLTDLMTPAALQQVQAEVVLNGQYVPGTLLTKAGSQSFTATAGQYEAYGVATAATPSGSTSATSGAGSYAATITPQGGGAPALSVARAVTDTSGTMEAFSFDTTLPAAATYAVDLVDFQFPSAITSLSLVAVQNGALVGTPISGSTTENITGASGPITLLAFGTKGSAGGLFGASITTSGASSPTFEVTQAVGTLFVARQVSVTVAGNYQVTAADLGFPANFANFDVIVTRGTANAGSIFGVGSFIFAATPGNYFINFIAQPGGSALAGTYSVAATSAPPSPVITLSVDQTSVSSGSTVNLKWSTQNATTCTASGGWSGSQQLSGTVTSSALTSNTTFTLSCTGAGGTTQQSVTVTVTAPSGHGSGALDLDVLAALAALLLGRRFRRPGIPM